MIAARTNPEVVVVGGGYARFYTGGHLERNQSQDQKEPGHVSRCGRAGADAMSRSDVIVGLDDSVAAQAALGWAAQHARVYCLRLTAVHVSAFLADPPVGWSPDTAPSGRRSDLELGPVAERVRTRFSSTNPGPGWSLSFVGGAPGPTLVGIARNAGLLALGTREHTGVGRLLAGSVSHFSLSHSTVPIAAIPAPVDSIVRSTDSAQIVVGLDDSPSGIAALEWAAALARRSAKRLLAIHLLGWPLGFVPKDYPEPPERRLTYQEIDMEYRGSISRLFDKMEPEPNWHLEFVEGHPGKVLVQRSKDSALLVIGTQEMVGLGRLLMGSVSHYGLSHAICPVVAVPATYPLHT